MIKEVVKTRTKTQVRSHAQKVFKKFTEEDLLMMKDEESEEVEKSLSLSET